MDKLLLTPTEAAQALGIGRSKIYELLQTGELRSVRIGTCRRIPTDALEQFLAGLVDARWRPSPQIPMALTGAASPRGSHRAEVRR
jgi:excisionase family DNA binding protein